MAMSTLDRHFAPIYRYRRANWNNAAPITDFR